MRVVAFVGPSGTGKSYRALWVAKQKNIDYIIDDGLLIGNNKVIAGYSAKKEPTKIAAIRRACFFDLNHVNDVKNALNSCKPGSILIIATSDGMADTIRKALGFNEISETVYINNVATKEEMDRALQVRKNEGKHVIPVPTFELKKTFSGYFMDALKIFKKKGNTNFVAEKTIVRPSYSYLGRYIISDAVIRDIVRFVAYRVTGVNKITSIDVTNYDDNISVTANIIVNYIDLDKSLFPKLQQVIKEEIERLTCMNVIRVNITLKSLRV